PEDDRRGYSVGRATPSRPPSETAGDQAVPRWGGQAALRHPTDLKIASIRLPKSRCCPLSKIASMTKKRAAIHPSRASAARFVAGRRARKTNGSAHAATSGTLSTREASVQPAYTNGLRHSAYRAPVGRRIRIGTPERAD